MVAADLADVVAVGVDAGERFRSSPDPRIAACADHDPWGEADLAPFVEDGRAWVATEDGAVVGYLVAAVHDGCGHVEEVSVDRAHGGRGHASALLDVAARWAVALGLPAVTLTTFRDVAWNRPFYERRGYRVVPEDEWSAAMAAKVAHEESAYGLPAELRVVMRRDLPPT
jgi:GNAT superfamily N-acetyltransferase